MEKHCDWLSVCFRFHFLYHKILKISPREYTLQRPFLRGLYTERNGALQNWLGLYTWRKICLRIDWASLQLEETLCQKLLLKNVLRR